MRDVKLLGEALQSLSQAHHTKQVLEKNQKAIGAIDNFVQGFAQALSKVRHTSSDSGAQVKPTENVAVNSYASSLVPPPSSSLPTDVLASIAQARAVALPPALIPLSEQNVVNSSMRSTYVYTADKNAAFNKMWQLEDGVRRATDVYADALVNAKSGHCSFVSSPNGLPVYMTREQIIDVAKTNVEKTQQHLAGYKNFINDPVARAAAEVGYQITHGVASSDGVELSLQDKILVRERRAGNTSTDGSISLMKS